MRSEYLFQLTGSILIIAAVMLMTVTGECKDKEAFCSWFGSPTQIDGTLDEWRNLPTSFFEDERLVVGVGNDSASIFIFLKTDDRQLIGTIQRMGISIWLDPKGKKKQDLCFQYRGGPTRDELMEAGLIDTSGVEDRMDSDRMRPMMDRAPRGGNSFVLTDKKLELNETIPVDGTYGPQAEYAFDHGFCIYEISIPLQDHLIDYYGFNAEPGQQISVGLNWGGMPDRNMIKDGPPGGMGGGGRGGGMGGRGGIGGRGGGGGGSRGGGRMQSSEEKEFWIKTSLAVPQSSDD